MPRSLPSMSASLRTVINLSTLYLYLKAIDKKGYIEVNETYKTLGFKIIK